jgi:hypothetical protein
MKVQPGLYAFALIFGMVSSGCSSGSSNSTSSGEAGSSGNSSKGGSGGTSSGGESCPEVEACGGDVVGTWEVKSQCLTFDGKADIGYLGLTCVPNVADIKGSINVTGKLTLGSDSKFKDETVTTGSEDWQLDKSCLILSGTRVNCESIGTTFQGALISFGYESMVCANASSGGGCTCADKINTNTPDGRPGGMGILHNDATTKGTYKVAGNKLNIGDSLSYSYCVKGSEMTLSPIPVANSATPYKGTIVLTKKDGGGGAGGSSSAAGGSSSAAGGSGGTSTASSSSKPPTSGGSTANGGTSTRPMGGSGGSAGGTGGGQGGSSKAGSTTGGTSAAGGSSVCLCVQHDSGSLEELQRSLVPGQGRELEHQQHHVGRHHQGHHAGPRRFR